VAAYPAYDYYSFRGEHAIANGWLQRAHRLLEGLDLTPEQSYSPSMRQALTAAIRQDMEAPLREVTEDGHVVLPFHVHIAAAKR
jgi:hypothetical protein